jgi:hypothetical protein
VQLFLCIGILSAVDEIKAMVVRNITNKAFGEYACSIEINYILIVFFVFGQSKLLVIEEIYGSS